LLQNILSIIKLQTFCAFYQPTSCITSHLRLGQFAPLFAMLPQPIGDSNVAFMVMSQAASFLEAPP